jgi:transposase
MRRHEIGDEQWMRIKDLLPGKASDPGRTAADNRLFVNAVVWVARAGEVPGKWTTPPGASQRGGKLPLRCQRPG